MCTIEYGISHSYQLNRFFSAGGCSTSRQSSGPCLRASVVSWLSRGRGRSRASRLFGLQYSVRGPHTGLDDAGVYEHAPGVSERAPVLRARSKSSSSSCGGSWGGTRCARCVDPARGAAPGTGCVQRTHPEHDALFARRMCTSVRMCCATRRSRCTTGPPPREKNHAVRIQSRDFGARTRRVALHGHRLRAGHAPRARALRAQGVYERAVRR